MLYYAYQAQCDALAPLRLLAEAARRVIDWPWPMVHDLPLVRDEAARFPDTIHLTPIF